MLKDFFELLKQLFAWLTRRAEVKGAEEKLEATRRENKEIKTAIEARRSSDAELRAHPDLVRKPTSDSRPFNPEATDE